MPSGSTLAMLLEPSTRLNSVRCFVNIMKFDGCGTALQKTWCLQFAHLNDFKHKNFHRIYWSSRFRRGTHGKLWPQLCLGPVLTTGNKSPVSSWFLFGRFFLKKSTLRKARFCVFFSESRVFERWGLSRRSIGRFAPSFVLLNSLCFVSAWEPHTKVSVTYAIMWQAHDVWFPTP